jgi:hypothetical protein
MCHRNSAQSERGLAAVAGREKDSDVVSGLCKNGPFAFKECDLQMLLFGVDISMN